MEARARKVLKCRVFPTLVGDEEAAMMAVLRSRESINRILGKSIGPGVSGNFRYYIAMCHLANGGKTRELIEQGEKLLLESAQMGCADAWWVLAERVEDKEEYEHLEYILRGYILGQPQCKAYVAADPEAIIAAMVLFLPSCQENGGQFIRHFLQIALDFSLRPYCKVLVMPIWMQTLEIPAKDREAVEDLLRTMLLPEGDTLYAKIAEAYDLAEDIEGID